MEYNMVMSFNPTWRDNAIETLVSDDIDTILTAKGEYNDEFFLSEMLTGGFKGYNAFTDEELERELVERDISTVFGDNDD
jgi:hypothetical protein